ncbi:MAG: glycosyltransferase family 2 protein [Actinobacteria bacterium]|nr:glycosyltransferase family 2 protein [Actinomycetota bacterium]
MDDALTAPPPRHGWEEGRLPPKSPFRRIAYLNVRTRFAISIVVALMWAGFSTWLAVTAGWVSDLADFFSLPGAILVVAGIAVIPGYLSAQLLVAIMFDRPRSIEDLDLQYPTMTLLIAAYNEEQSIRNTLEHARKQDYPAQYEIVVIDDGSEDATREIVNQVAAQDSRVRLIEAEHGGKSSALNRGLYESRTRMVATVDADTLLMPQSLRRATARFLISPADTVAIAGDVLVRNPRDTLMTRMQDWDYVLGIASVKRQQGLVRGTLVAQGAFSVYDARALRMGGGWPDMIGEDIVLTWTLLVNGGRVAYEPTAVAYTDVPEKIGAFFRQRKRWARGMIEGLREHGGELVARHRIYSYAVGVNWGFPYLDFVFTFVWIPGLVLALTGNFMIVGPMSLAVIPLNALITFAMYRRQRTELARVGLSIRRNFLGFVAYFFLYQLIMAPVSVYGYCEEIIGGRRNW